MYKKDIDKIYYEIEQLIYDQKLAEAIQQLEIFLRESMSFNLQADFEQTIENYKYLLSFFVRGIEDPERKNIYDRICSHLFELNDKFRQNAYFYCPELPHFKGKNYFNNQGKLTHETANQLLEKIISSKVVADMLSQAGVSDEDESIEKQSRQLIDEIFRIFWLTDHYDDAEIYLFKKVLEHETIQWYEKSLLVSAVTLGLLNNFDVGKFSVLIQAYLNGIPHIRERALVGLFLAIYKYDKRLKHYPALLFELSLMSDHADFKDDLKSLISQLIITKDTEKLSKKIQEEILPEVIKHAPKITQNLDIEKIFSDKDEDEKNPKWKEVFKDTPELYDKLEELSKLQMQGSDMFIGTFSQLKHFPFFNNLINWLLPFYAEEKHLKNIFTQENNYTNIAEFLSAMEIAPYICNSDKYSFCFNLKALPEQQKLILLDMFIEETHSLKELLNEEGKTDKNTRTRIIFTQYLQDLYRFFKLNPQKNHFEDVFSWQLDIYNTSTFNYLVNNQDFLKEIGDYYFSKEHYQEAGEIFQRLSQNMSDSAEIFQKLAFCYQKQKNYEKAIEYYFRADLIDTENLWTWRKLAYCYLKLDNFEQALKYYTEIEKKNPGNWKISAYIAHCLFSLQQYEQALNIFYKADWLNPDNPQIIKSIAYINMLLGKFDEAHHQYLKIPSDQLNHLDLMRMGHLYWCRKEFQDAISYYLKSMVNFTEGYTGFIAQFKSDQNLFLKNYIKSDHLPLLMDYLKMYKEGKIT